jgi:hypothetical protein
MWDRPFAERAPVPTRLLVVGLSILLAPHVGVVGVLGCARAGDDFLDGAEGVALAARNLRWSPLVTLRPS